MKRLIFAVVLLSGLCASISSFGAGFIIVSEPREGAAPPPFPHPHPFPRTIAPLVLESEAATIRIDDQVATTTLTQEFHNPNAQRLEGTFILPVPRGAVLDKFTLEIDGKPVSAELLAAD